MLDRDGTPQPKQALVNVMRLAIERAGLQPADIGHVNAHGCGSRRLDQLEAEAIHEVFGDYGSQVPVTAIKSYTGNSGSGCGPIEVAASLLSLADGRVPATLNYDAPDPDCRLNVVSAGGLETSNKTFLKVNVTRMGQASAVVIRAV